MEKLVAKIAMGHDIAHMYSNENRPGTCPICRRCRILCIKCLKRKEICFILMMAFGSKENK